MTVRELLAVTRGEPNGWQLSINAFVDAFRRVDVAERQAMIADGLDESDRMEGLLAAVVSALCRETGVPAPDWVGRIHSPEPFFVPGNGICCDTRLITAVVH